MRVPRHGAFSPFVRHPKNFAAKDSFLISLKQINLLLGVFTEDSLAVVGGKWVLSESTGVPGGSSDEVLKPKKSQSCRNNENR